MRFLPRGPLGWGLVLFTLAFGFRLFDMFVRDKFQVYAYCEVERAAITLARTGTMGDAFGPGTGPTAHVPPLYTLLLAGLHSTFGIDSREAVMAQRILSAFVASLGIALLPLVARRAKLNLATGVVAGFILALSPCYFFVECYGKQETAYAALLGMGLLLSWLRLRETGWEGRRAEVTFAILTALAGLLAPQLLAFIAFAMFGDFLVRPVLRGRLLRSGLVMAGISLVVIGPWTWRNWHALGGFVPLRSNFALELHVGNNPVADGWTFAGSTTDSASTTWPHPYSHPGEKARLKEVGELVYMREKSTQAKSWIKEHPGEFVRLTLRRAYLFWFPPASVWSVALDRVPVRVAFTAVLTALAFVGLALLFREKHSARWVLLLALMAPSLVYLVTHVNPRYRYVNLALTALLAGHVLSRLRLRSWVLSRKRLNAVSVTLPRLSAARAAGSRPAPCESPPVCVLD